MKIPTVAEPLYIRTQQEWTRAMDTLSKTLLERPMGCPRWWPLVIVCSGAQAGRVGAPGAGVEWDDLIAEYAEHLSRNALPRTFVERFGDTTFAFDVSGTADQRAQEQAASTNSNGLLKGALGAAAEHHDWEECLRFFCLPPGGAPCGLTLVGMKRKAERYQLLDSYKTVRIFLGNKYTGVGNGSDAGLGKTLTTVMSMAILALAFMCKDDCVNHPELHAGPGESACRSNNPFGIECHCVRREGNLTRAICECLPRQPQFVVTPAGVTGQWTAAAEFDMTPTVVLRDGRRVSNVPLLLWADFGEPTRGEDRLNDDDSTQYLERSKEIYDVDSDDDEEEVSYEDYSRFVKKDVRKLNTALYRVSRQAMLMMQDFEPGLGNPVGTEPEEADEAARERNQKVARRAWLRTRDRLTQDRTRPIKVTLDATLALGEEAAYRQLSDDTPARVIFEPRPNGASASSKKRVYRSISKERLVLVSSVNKFRSPQFSNHFDIATPTGDAITEALRASTVVYDEWFLARDKKTDIIRALRAACGVDWRHAGKRPLVVLLSATPMANGPNTISGVLPLVLRKPKDGPDMELLQRAFKEAERMGQDEDSDSQASVAARKRWEEAVHAQLGGFLFGRWFGMRFLDGTIRDPRLGIARSRPLPLDMCPADRERLQGSISSLRTEIRERLDGRGGHGHGQGHGQVNLESMVTKSAHFDTIRQCQILPGRLRVSLQQKDVGGPRNKLSLSGKIVDAKCRQLTLIEEIIRRNGAAGPDGRADATGYHGVRSGLILTTSPLNALIVHEWLRTRLASDGFKVVLENLTSNSPPPRQRPPKISELADRTLADRQTATIIVSTYQLMGVGIDGLQQFVSYVIELGEAFTHAEMHQAENRVYRRGQRRIVKVYKIRGGPGSWDLKATERNARREQLTRADILGFLGLGSKRREEGRSERGVAEGEESCIVLSDDD